MDGTDLSLVEELHAMERMELKKLSKTLARAQKIVHESLMSDIEIFYYFIGLYLCFYLVVTMPLSHEIKRYLTYLSFTQKHN